MTKILKHLTVITIAATLVGCETPGPRPTPTTTLEYKLPVLTPVEPDKQDQEKDGIRVSVAGYTYTAKQTGRKEFRALPAILVANHQYPAEMRQIPAVSVFPREVRFKVKIYNRLERVLRLAGTVVSFQVAGKTVAVPKARYEEFLNGIILPRQEAEYEVGGPDLADLADNATIAFFLYDIVTATDAAGNPTKRSNFEFFYTLSRQAKTEQVSLTTRQVSVSQGAYALMRQRGQASGHQWVAMPELEREMSGL